MQAIVRDGSGVTLRETARPTRRSDDVVVRVAACGICRTDLRVARGLIGGRSPLILGHEIAGVVEDVGAAARVRPGARVAVMPAISCGRCADCARATSGSGPWAVCPEHRMLGVDLDGGFAEYVVVPDRSVYPIPDTMAFRTAAFAEPVAAAMAVLRAGLREGDRGLVIGGGRIAALTRRVLQAAGFTFLEGGNSDETAGEPAAVAGQDFAIETAGTADGLAAAVAAVRRGGTVVVKSRPAAPIAFDVVAALRKEITVRVVAWAPLAAALDLLASGRLPIDDLLGEIFPLAGFEAAFRAAEAAEARKLFLAPVPEAVR